MARSILYNLLQVLVVPVSRRWSPECSRAWRSACRHVADRAYFNRTAICGSSSARI